MCGSFTFSRSLEQSLFLTWKGSETERLCKLATRRTKRAHDQEDFVNFARRNRGKRITTHADAHFEVRT